MKIRNYNNEFAILFRILVKSDRLLEASPTPRHHSRGRPRGRAATTRSRGRSAGSSARLGLRRVKARTRGIAVVGFALARVLGRRCLQFLQLQFQLIQLEIDAAKAKYKLRKCTVEPVFAVIKNVLGFTYFHLRGLEGVTLEWLLVTMAYNCKQMTNIRTA